MNCHGRGCNYCADRGKETCFRCKGDGTIEHWLCRGSGKVNCGTCAGSGIVQCNACSGKGLRHYFATIDCSIYSYANHSVDTDDALEAHDLRSMDLADLRTMTKISQSEPQLSDLTFTRFYNYTATLSELEVTAHGASVRILGIGPDKRIVNFNNIVGILLENDLLALSEVLKRTRLFRFPWKPEVAEPLRKFLESSANQRIVTEAAWHTETTVNGDYAKRAKHTFESVIRKSILPSLSIGVIPSFVLTVACMLGLLAMGIRGGIASLVFATTAIGLAGIILYRFALSRLLTVRLGPAIFRVIAESRVYKDSLVKRILVAAIAIGVTAMHPAVWLANCILFSDYYVKPSSV